MTANDHIPIGSKPWRLTAAHPGILDIFIDVEDPVSWEVGSDQTPGRITEPICGRFPTLTTRGNIRGLKGKFILFIQDGDDRDKVIDAILAASQDDKIPYFVWTAVDGTASWNVQFDPADKINIGWLSGHRVMSVSFLQMGQNLTTVPPGLVGLTPPPIPGKPTVSCALHYAYRGESIPIKFTNSVSGDKGAFVGLFDPANTSNATLDAISYSYLGGAIEGQMFLTILPTATPALYELRLITTNPTGVVHGPKLDVRAATLTVEQDPFDFSQITFTWAGFEGGDPPFYLTDPPALIGWVLVPGQAPEAQFPISGTSGTYIWTRFGTSSPFTPMPKPQLVTLTGRKIMGPLS